jgi:hypothetical protein
LRTVAVVAFIAALIVGARPAFAGTTGTLTGTVTDAATHQPLAGAKVTVTSPSQNASATTDGGGRFVFLALAPDTYLVSVTVAGYDQSTVTGTTILADASRTLNIGANKTLQTIGKVTSRASTDLVKPGTTADVYSIDPTTQDKASGIGGGGALNTAFSALATVPGAFVPDSLPGYNASFNVSIRGGDYDQVGYEIDGVPVNRAFDQYPSGNESSLGQQELQVYTGAAPANAEGQGLSGFINQVIKTGTYPASSTLTADIGGPVFYHKFSIETGGATADRNFSYYVGLGGYNQDSRFADQFNGQSLTQLFGTPLAPCSGVPDPTPALVPSCFTGGLPNFNNGAGGFVLGGYDLFGQSMITDRDSVFNFHFGLPHKNGTKDDIQLLAMINYLGTQYYDSTNDQGGAAYLNAIGFGTPSYADGYQYNGPSGVPLPSNYQALTSQYYFPGSALNRAFDAPIPVDLRDGISNDQGIVKAQYTHAIGENALLKIYGYTYYSDWLQQGPQSAISDYFGPSGPDYELNAHTRGVSGTFTDQLGSDNLLSLQASYTTASTLRDNNTQFYNADGSRSIIGVLVDSTGGKDGLCYTANKTPTTCSFLFDANGNPGPAEFATITQAYAGTIAPAPAGLQYLVTNNGQYATYNTVSPKFTALSLTDTWKPTSKLSIDAGVRLDRFAFRGSDTTGTAARAFWYAAYDLDHCLTAGSAVVDKVNDLGLPSPLSPCPAGYSAANFTNPSGNVTESYDALQPRIGATYTLNGSTVLRGSYGRFAQAPSSAYQQYNTLQQDAPYQLYDVYGFQRFGFTSPDHTVVPPTSDNLDFSLEHQFGRDTSIKLSPFLRKTQNQIQQFYLNQQTGFVSGLNVGNQTSKGIELELDKGNFGRNGLAAKLALAYTNSYIRYGPLANGSSIIDPLNAQIVQYNSYTSYCAAHPTAATCSGQTPQYAKAAAPCYTPAIYNANGTQIGGGAPVFACSGADVANPYWNAPVQALLDPNGDYPTYDTFPAGIGTSVSGYGAPYTATLLLQYKRDRFAFTPALQFFAGQRYGSPPSTLGIAPDTCSATLGATAGDPRYNYGAVGGSSFDYTTCGQLPGGIPDPYTNKFDTIGAFAAPNELQFHVQMTYDVSSRVSLVVNLTNIVNECFGGTKTGFTVKGACSYGVVAAGATGDAGNTYNPGTPIQPYVNTPYEPTFSLAPFGVYVSARIKI